MSSAILKNLAGESIDSPSQHAISSVFGMVAETARKRISDSCGKEDIFKFKCLDLFHCTINCLHYILSNDNMIRE
jgi:hypothetical protein